MVISQIAFGLGNQMFQYAAARRLAHIHGSPLKLDLQHFSAGTGRRYGLEAFKIDATLATSVDLRNLCPQEWLHRQLRSCLPLKIGAAISKLLRLSGVASPYHLRTGRYGPKDRLPPLLVRGVASERRFDFDRELLSAPDNVCLCGYWQTEKYFHDIPEVIRKEFTLAVPLSPSAESVLARIRSSPSVAMHVRRGDKADNQHIPGSTAAYCHTGMKLALESIPNAQFFIFTDDWEWVKQHFPQSSLCHHVRVADSPAVDLHLMSQCEHQIIAPSTFSWWAGWLNPNRQKLVIAPHRDRWLNLPNIVTKDALPDAWLEIC